MTRALARGGRTLALVSLGAAVLAACGAPEQRPVRMYSDTYEYRVTLDPSPPHAREPTIFKVVVLDRKTREFVNNGEGRIFATSMDHVNRWDSFVPGSDPGSYTARLNFITAGDWHVNLQFRPDSTRPLEKPENDIVQTVRGARPINERPTR